jgi:hypothetical protein
MITRRTRNTTSGLVLRCPWVGCGSPGQAFVASSEPRLPNPFVPSPRLLSPLNPKPHAPHSSAPFPFPFLSTPREGGGGYGYGYAGMGALSASTSTVNWLVEDDILLKNAVEVTYRPYPLSPNRCSSRCVD